MLVVGSVFVIYCLMTYSVETSAIKKKRSFTDNLHSGIKLAGQILGKKKKQNILKKFP